MPRIPRPLVHIPAAVVLAVTPLAVLAQLHIEIRGVGATQIPVAVANFAGDATPPTDIPQVVRDDLVNSGVFRNIDAGGQPISETIPVDFASWKNHGADALLTGSIQHMADGRNDVRFRLWDTVKQTSPGGQALTGPGNNPRLTAHNIADFVYEKLTGIRGVFSTRIAYVIRKNQQLYELQIADADGKNPKSALTSHEPIISPTWSPDGTRLAYVSFEQKKPVVYVHTITAGTRIAVSNFKGSNSSPAWSPDGQTLAVTLTRDGNSQIYLMNSDGSNLRRFTQSSGIDTEPAFSPDGQSVYFTSDRGGGPQIYRASLSGNDATRVTFSGDYNISPRVSPDGKTLVYIGRRGGKFQVFSLDLASGQEMTLTDSDKDESPSFAPNGKMILYATEAGGRGTLAAVSIDGAVHLRVGLDESGDVREPAWGPFAK